MAHDGGGRARDAFTGRFVGDGGRVTLDFSGLVELQRYLDRVVSRLSDHGPLQSRWGPKTIEWQQQNLELGKSPDGADFAPLSAAYAAWRTGWALSTKPGYGGDKRRHARKTIGRTAHPFGVRPLIDTTAMFATMIWIAPGPHEVSGGATARSFDGAPYPLFHQEGRGVTARPWSGFRRENLTELASDLHAFCLQGLKR